MYIQEAIKESLESGKWIRRKSWLTCFAGKVAIMPTNTWDCCIVGRLNHDTRSVEKQVRCWNPRAEDLAADDWEIIEDMNQQIMLDDNVVDVLDYAIEKSISKLINAKRGTEVRSFIVEFEELMFARTKLFTRIIMDEQMQEEQNK